MTFVLIICLIIIIILLSKNFSKDKEKEKFKTRLTSVEETKTKEILFLKKELENEKDALQNLKESTEYLKKYEPLKNIEDEFNRVSREKEQVIEESIYKADEIKKEARKEAREIKQKADSILKNTQEFVSKIERDAHLRAKDIAGEAWDAKRNAEQYEETVRAMRNIIDGYGDEYLIPNHSLLDDLAEEYNHEEAGQELKQTRTLIKFMIVENQVAECDYTEYYRNKTAIEFVIDAFNGKVDTIMSKVKHDNYGKLLQSLKDAFRIVNHNGRAFRDARINDRYFQVILDQLKLAVTVHELKKQDLQEQREIREAIREEEKARRDFEKARKEAEKEEKILEKARKEVEEKLSKAAAEDRAKLEEELNNIRQKLLIAEENGQRALSMAQQTKRGHVYIISNIGSFGENIFKIGLTRRLEPLDRVKELGDASVPFAFDVHAMIHSEDAPKLEKELHETFNLNRVNKINFRKEFFDTSISDIKEKIDVLT